MSTAKVRSNRFTALLLCIAAVLFMLIPHTLSDVSYTEERADKMLFPSLPMGTQEYFLFVDPVRTGYTSGDYGNFYGKRVGVNNNSIQAGYLRDWMNSYEIHADIVELTCTMEEAFEMLKQGELDGFVSMDAYGTTGSSIPEIRIGSDGSVPERYIPPCRSEYVS